MNDLGRHDLKFEIFSLHTPNFHYHIFILEIDSISNYSLNTKLFPIHLLKLLLRFCICRWFLSKNVSISSII